MAYNTEYITPSQINANFSLTLSPVTKAPVIGKRVFATLADAVAYMNDAADTATEGIILKVINDGNNNGAYLLLPDESATNKLKHVKLATGSGEAKEYTADGSTLVLDGSTNQFSVNLTNIPLKSDLGNLEINLTGGKDASGNWGAYTLTQGEKSFTIDFPKDMVVKSGQVVTNPEGQPEGKYIELTLNDDKETKIYINVNDLVDAYTPGSETDGLTVGVSDTNELTVSVTDATALKDTLGIAADISTAIENIGLGALATKDSVALEDLDASVKEQFGDKNIIESVKVNGITADIADKVASVNVYAGDIKMSADDATDVSSKINTMQTQINDIESTIADVKAKAGVTSLNGASGAITIQTTDDVTIKETAGKITVYTKDSSVISQAEYNSLPEEEKAGWTPEERDASLSPITIGMNKAEFDIVDGEFKKQGVVDASTMDSFATWLFGWEIIGTEESPAEP